MTKKLKKLLSVVLVLVMLVSAIPMSGATLLAGAAASNGQCGDSVYWTLDNEGTLTISGAGEMYNYDEWDEEAASPFCENTSIRNVVIQDGVTAIGDSAFWYCTGLTSVTIPNTVTTIGDCAFYGCSKLENATIGNGVTTIGDFAFYGCGKLTSVIIPNSVVTVGYEAFADCSKLSSVTIGNNVTYIGASAFDNTALYNNKSNWENDVLYIGNYLIQAKDTISGAYMIKGGTRVIAEDAFSYCENLTSVTIPESVITICDGAFDSCSKLTSIAIPDSVTYIGFGAFWDCVSLSNITIGNGVTSIGSFAFDNTAFYNNDSNWENGVLYIGKYLISADSALVSGAYTIKDGTKLIADYAFTFCGDLISVTIPGSVKAIGDSAFFTCEGLANVTIPDSVTSIGECAFYNCKSLKNILIPDSVIMIGDSAFGYCDYYFNGFYHPIRFKVDGFTVYGHTGSEAERYANENELEFVPYTDQHIHYYNCEVITPATCTEDGARRYVCDCGDSYETVIPAKGHYIIDGGRKCAVCGKSFQVSLIDRMRDFFMRIFYWLISIFR